MLLPAFIQAYFLQRSMMRRLCHRRMTEFHGQKVHLRKRSLSPPLEARSLTDNGVAITHQKGSIIRSLVLRRFGCRRSRAHHRVHVVQLQAAGKRKASYERDLSNSYFKLFGCFQARMRCPQLVNSPAYLPFDFHGTSRAIYASHGNSLLFHTRSYLYRLAGNQ